MELGACAPLEGCTADCPQPRSAGSSGHSVTGEGLQGIGGRREEQSRAVGPRMA